MYRTIRFREGDKTWGYPLPHLLGMKLNLTGVLRGDQIALRFSTTDVLIEGTNLGLLWQTLVESEEEHRLICTGTLARDKDGRATCTVTRIKPGKLSPKWEMQEKASDQGK